MNKEFDIIENYFSFSKATREVPITVGDDCAIFTPPFGHTHIATSADLLIEGQHFFSDVNPKNLGHKALAVNLSDLAAMGAEPIGCLLSLALPSIDQSWIAQFTEGFRNLSEKYMCPLIGGDLSKSKMGIIINVTVFGGLNVNFRRSATSAFMTRAGARAGDDIWVSGNLGKAHLAYTTKRDNPNDLAKYAMIFEALELPEPRIDLGKSLIRRATSCIDISDGLVQDLGHIMKSSKKTAEIHLEKIPYDKNLEKQFSKEQIREAILSGGDCYELCFTAPPENRAIIERLSDSLQLKLTRIGEVSWRFNIDRERRERVKRRQELRNKFEKNNYYVDTTPFTPIPHAQGKPRPPVEVYENGELIEVPNGGFQHF
ncbi:thiamine-phosphate kinase [Taylorella asinigenitalis]|uniref:Thiamine-monophosphate kinase n=1 Tax=Taylorella asinigenitalis (strain MCE3) TaxID=1008459 RepID=G4QCK2_TAYAM|nr:thiamine-phosphate kinase [Taylorella asinigenitalis]AEP36132.1 Thiamine-monophosphate kinase [Taylorella asinigenitalis MCE3]